MIPVYIAALLFGGILIAASLVGGKGEDQGNDGGHEADGHEADGHEADGHEADGHEADGHEADGHEADGHETQGHDVAHDPHGLESLTDSGHSAEVGHSSGGEHSHELAHGPSHGVSAHPATHVSEAASVLSADRAPARSRQHSAIRTAVTSLRFWTFATAAFGMSGLLLTPLGMPALLTALLAGVTGVGVGGATLKLFQALRQSDVTSQTELQGLEGTEGTSLLPIAPGGLGKVRVVYGGQITDLLARSLDTAGIEQKQKVLIVGVEAGIVVVTRLASLPEPHHQREAACQKISQ